MSTMMGGRLRHADGAHDLHIAQVSEVGLRGVAAPHIRFADGELTSATWFTRTKLPDLPTLPSLSRRLIDAWIAGEIE